MKKYSLLYNKIKNMILSGELGVREKVPSVRNAARLYNVSITTVQNAYFDLCADGYLISRDKSGYYVTDFNSDIVKEDYEHEESQYDFDLTGGIADKDSFDFKLWQRYIKSALRQSDRLLSYSQPKGEYDLRCAISQYIKDKRNVITSPDRIIIGAGVQPLMQILCVLLNKKEKNTVSFPDKSFVQGINIFSSYGFNVHTRDKDADIIYVSPSHMTRWGDVMPIKRRIELIEYSQKHNSIVIEDDYENEFLYNVKPTPSLFALGKGNIIYMGSFSAMLLPGIRISFMVLTKELTEVFNSVSASIAQTASKTEQIALCNYIRDGHIKSQTRKIRRLYTAKTKAFAEKLKTAFPNSSIDIGENTLQIIFKEKFNKDISVFDELKIRVFVDKIENDSIVLVLSPSGISYDDFDTAISRLKKAIV